MQQSRNWCLAALHNTAQDNSQPCSTLQKSLHNTAQEKIEKKTFSSHQIVALHNNNF
jgi:hypothetical protein